MICKICQKAARKKESFVATKCGHCFHKSCIEDVLEDSKLCPTCSEPIDKSSLLKLFFELEDKNDEQEKEVAKLNDEVFDKMETIKDLRKCLKITEERIKELKEQNETHKEKIAGLETDLQNERKARPSQESELKKLKEVRETRETSRNFQDWLDSSFASKQELEPQRPSLNYLQQLQLRQDNNSERSAVTRSLFSGYGSQTRQASSVSCKSCKTGCSKGYCACFKSGNRCSALCGCTGCAN